jgi:type II secretion system protein N
MNPRVQALVDRVRAFVDNLTPRQRRIAGRVGYPLFALLVALLTFYWSMPRERVKDRLETALSADVSSGQPLAIGMDVTIGDLALTLFTGAGFKASDIVLKTRPVNPSDKPVRYLIDDVRVRLGLLSTMFGRPSYSFKAHALSGVVSGHAAGNNDETKVKVEVEKLVLNNAPGIQQAMGGLPLDGTVSGKLDVQVPKNLLANANGTIDVDIADLAIGDGKAKLTVPNDPFLSAGLTFPRIRLGRLQGQIVIDKGRARFEGVRVHSADADATLEGYVELHDPIGTSQMHAYLKFRPSEALLKREPTVELLNNALTATARRNDGYIGIQLTGPLASIFFLPSKEPPFGVTSRSEPASAAAAAPPAAKLPTFTPPPNAPLPSPPPSPEPGPPAAAAPPPAPSPTGASAGPSGTPVPSTPPPANVPAEGGREVAPPPPAPGAPQPGSPPTPPPPSTGNVVAPPAMRSFRGESEPARAEER